MSVKEMESQKEQKKNMFARLENKIENRAKMSNGRLAHNLVVVLKHNQNRVNKTIEKVSFEDRKHHTKTKNISIVPPRVKPLSEEKKRGDKK